MFSLFRLTTFEGDTILSKGYRVTKGALAAAIPLAKVVNCRIKNTISRGFRKIQSGFRYFCPQPRRPQPAEAPERRFRDEDDEIGRN